MGLRFDGGDFNELAVSLHNAAKRSTRKVRLTMRRTVNKVKDLSVRQTPVDLHNLEEAHEVTEKRGASNRIEFAVEVGGVVGGRNVDDYAAYVHENYSSVRNVGEGTLAKRAANPDIYVGEKFLERAFQTEAADIGEEIADVVIAEFL